MKPQLELLAERLTQEDRAELNSIFAPRVVMTPPIDTRCGLCVLPDGEIRYYGFDRTSHLDFSTPVYWASGDCGLSWKKHFMRGPTQHASAFPSPYSGRYISVITPTYRSTGLRIEGEGGAYVALSDSPASTDVSLIRITDLNLWDMYLPIALRSRRRIACAGHLYEHERHRPVVLFSDDDGETWDLRFLEGAPLHEARWPHRGVRWQNEASEPTLAELSDGTLLLLARTSLGVLYQYLSRDGGETWSAPSPSSFHSTLTSPQLHTLSDGRLLLFWCNTQPLPEMDHHAQRPELTEREKRGRGEDFFTNRDACHAAISEDDGRTWRGFREIFLNEIRDRSDYRSLGGCADTLDKSVHQFQAVELPEGRVLLSFGQHPAARRAVIFAVDWLYETGRAEDFLLGLSSVSTQVFVKSVPGQFRGKTGHCSLNRTHGALLLPDPDGLPEEALFLSTLEDPRLLSPLQGMVWNFPAAQRGALDLDLRVEGAGLRVSLTDRWFNPIDDTVRYFAQHTVEVDRGMMLSEGWTRLRWTWDESRVQLSRGEELLLTLPLLHPAPHGLSYLHVQTLCAQPDARGAWIKRMAQRAL